jgi:hypothetical protein
MGIATSANSAPAASPITSIGTGRQWLDTGNISQGGSRDSTNNFWNVSANTDVYPTVNISSPSSSGFDANWYIWAIRIA